MEQTIDNLFSKIEDPRVEGRCLHKLKDILFIALCTLLSNGEDYEDMVEFANQRHEWLKEILELPNGIPSHDTFNRVLQIIEPEQLMNSLQADGELLIKSVQGQLVSFDGKKLRGVSPKSRGNKGVYILSAWVNEHRICIGQKRVKDKSNEIEAIPDLIDMLDLEGSTVSIDAIGCQVDIAKKIIEAKANYLLAVKKNQKDLYEEISDDFTWAGVQEFNETWEYDHGRYETRQCYIVPASEFLSPIQLERWIGVKTLVKIVAQRTIDNVTSSQTRYYISSAAEDNTFYNENVKGHWGIENHLHWHLDISFNEDASRSRRGHAPENLNILRKMALHRISKAKDKLSLKKRRFRASMNIDYLKKIIGLNS